MKTYDKTLYISMVRRRKHLLVSKACESVCVIGSAKTRDELSMLSKNLYQSGRGKQYPATRCAIAPGPVGASAQ